MKPAPRFWPLAALILLPVLVLAGVSVWFLTGQRRTVMADAKATAGSMAASAGILWEQLGAAFWGKEDSWVHLYDELPVPGTPSPQAETLERAIREKDVEALRELSSAGESQGTTASGLPVRVLAAWTLFQWEPGPAEAKRLRQLATSTEPSAISPAIVRALVPHFEWAGDDWADTEAQRYELRTAMESGWMPPAPGEGTPPSLILQRATLPRPGGPEEHAPAGGRGLVSILGWSDGRTAVVLDDRRPEEAARRVQQEHRNAGITWAFIRIREAGANPSTEPPGPLAVISRPGYSVFVHLTSESALYAGYYRLVWWCSGIIGCALFTALWGIGFVHRTLNKERRLGELKSQFVSSVSHELRAPVGSLRLMAEGLASGKVSGPPADEFHRLMASEGARLSSLIENVLDFARIEQGRKQYVFSETDIIALVHDAVKVMTPQAEARGQKILTDLPPLPFIPQVDAGALQQALINLLDNAIKFSPPNVARHSNVEFGADSTCRATCGEVRITLAHDASAKTWSLSVADDGPGIPAAEHERIFERFYRLGNELRRETTGTGIGLAIVKHIVEGHGGRVVVESELGRGSVFTMVFRAQCSVLSFHAPSTEH